ncbi:DDE superfamily endonuclease [Popillia japonica]|uniref:Putative nuclease HARBI1 n=1 Tax=Popillia japonica TaxID=7064 RepID=A0AAW1M0D4_POPJA
MWVVFTEVNYFDEYDNQEFLSRFQLQKNTCVLLLQEIEDAIKSPTNQKNAVSPATKLLLKLRFYAIGSMLLVAGDFMGDSKSSACVAERNVTNAIAGMSDRYIKFPATQEEQENQKICFYNIARFSCMLGAIDCTHVRIQSPGGNEAEQYRNRKGFFSWNVQVISDTKLCIQDIIARWPGRSHDQTIFDNSRIKARFEVNEFGNGLLLGDSGYGIKPYLITPLINPVTVAEQLFHESQIRSRNVVERLFGVWKRRFPILSFGMRVSLERSKAIIVATAVLHNLAISEGEDVPPLQREQVMDEVEQEENNRNENNVNNARRQALINNHFAHLL